jgi:hypothetical protein
MPKLDVGSMLVHNGITWEAFQPGSEGYILVSGEDGLVWKKVESAYNILSNISYVNSTSWQVISSGFYNPKVHSEFTKMQINVYSNTTKEELSVRIYEPENKKTIAEAEFLPNGVFTPEIFTIEFSSKSNIEVQMRSKNRSYVYYISQILLYYNNAY